MEKRTSTLQRNTKETNISVEINLDGTGKSEISTSNGMLDHLISQLSRHGLVDITLTVTGDIETGWHHIVEDTAISLGRSIREALGDARGIHRMGHAIVPLDDSLAFVSVDLSGRGYARIDDSLANLDVENLSGDLVSHFLEALAVEAKITLHVRIMNGTNSHHICESIFKALAKSLRQALTIDTRSPYDVPSTKGTIDL